jgi:hypothetical protein
MLYFALSTSSIHYDVYICAHMYCIMAHSEQVPEGGSLVK